MIFLKPVILNNLPLNLNTFNIKKNIIYTQKDMDKAIHNIHNYIRDYTKISNEDKSFFIACILVTLKKDNFMTLL